jgi:hypothetical protein
MPSWSTNESHRENHLRLTKTRLNRAAVHLERYADQLRQLAEGDRLDSRDSYAEAVGDAVGDLGNVLSNAGLEHIVQMAARADTFRELVQLQQQMEAARGE